MNDKISSVAVQIAFSIFAIYLFNQFLKALEAETEAFNKQTRDILLDLFNSVKPAQAEEPAK